MPKPGTKIPPLPEGIKEGTGKLREIRAITEAVRKEAPNPPTQRKNLTEKTRDRKICTEKTQIWEKGQKGGAQERDLNRNRLGPSSRNQEDREKVRKPSQRKGFDLTRDREGLSMHIGRDSQRRKSSHSGEKQNNPGICLVELFADKILD
ncbi:hypothetical protein ACFXTH_001360 [Malus domestica]